LDVQQLIKPIRITSGQTELRKDNLNHPCTRY